MAKTAGPSGYYYNKKGGARDARSPGSESGDSRAKSHDREAKAPPPKRKTQAPFQYHGAKRASDYTSPHERKRTSLEEQKGVEPQEGGEGSLEHDELSLNFNEEELNFHHADDEFSECGFPQTEESKIGIAPVEAHDAYVGRSKTNRRDRPKDETRDEEGILKLVESAGSENWSVRYEAFEQLAYYF